MTNPNVPGATMHASLPARQSPTVIRSSDWAHRDVLLCSRLRAVGCKFPYSVANGLAGLKLLLATLLLATHPCRAPAGDPNRPNATR